jgi:hypothetical protein
MKQTGRSTKALVVGSLIAVFPLLLAMSTPRNADGAAFGMCDATGASACCVCSVLEPAGGGESEDGTVVTQSVACTSIAEDGVWSCTSEFCSDTNCYLVNGR